MTNADPHPASPSQPTAGNDHNEPNRDAPFPIVGVGASAGGLEAFTELLRHLPVETGMGFVLVQHLDPQHESALTQLLSRATSMPVHEVTQDLRVEANCVYVIPPNANLGIEQGVLKLQPRPQTRSPHHSIDSFFESLSRDAGERAIGVVLSGAATDGTLGLEAIKAEGGITFAQDDSARYDSMPRSAVAAGCVDLVLSPANIAKELTRIARHPYVTGQSPASDIPAEDDRTEATAHEDDDTPLPSGGQGTPRTGATQARAEAAVEHGDRSSSSSRDKSGDDDGYKKILLLLRNHSGVDFSLYKSSTIQRRIARRTVLGKHADIDAYARFLRGNSKELDMLYSDVLIGVTSFFRNPEAFEFLKRKVLPQILPERRDDPFRIWTLGCSTGQEAYSLAMAFTEFCDQIPRPPKLQLFATDLNDALLEKARAGLYAKSVADDISPERLRRFFVEEDGGYRVIKPLRETIVFARQNFLSDPPFSRMNLISCRNLLIYLKSSLQKKILPTFHYALKPEGCLFLGASETIGPFTDLFEPLDKKHKIYSRKPGPSPALEMRLSPHRAAAETTDTRPPDASEGLHPEVNAQREADRVTRSRYAPPSVLINAEWLIMEFRGDTSPYLRPPTGQASFHLLKMAREGLMLPLRTALNKAKKDNKIVRKENVRLDQHDHSRTANFEVVPLKNVKERCYLVFFEDNAEAADAPSTKPAKRRNARVATKEESRRLAELETDLAETRDYVQSLQEQHEAAREELQAANEEVTSANEELQSINEELETSKEELESANEELTTVNEEMANRNIELNRLNSDLVNFQTSTRLCIVLLGRDLCIRRFSMQAEKQFNLLATDVGRPISNVRHSLVFDKVDAPASSKFSAHSRSFVPACRDVETSDVTAVPSDLESFIAEVIADVRERECEVRDKEGRWYSLRVRPYLTLDNKLDGAVLVLVDIDALKRSEQAVAAARDYAEAIVRTVPDPLLILNADFTVHTANEAFYSTFQVAAAESEGRVIFELGDGQWKIPELRELLEDVLLRRSSFNAFEVIHDFEDVGPRIMLLNARPLNDSRGQPSRILLGIQDISELSRFQAEVRRSEQRYRRLFEAARDGVLILDPTTRQILDANPFMSELLGYRRDELLGKELFEIGLLQDETASRKAFQELQDKGFLRYEDLPLESKTGQRCEVEMVSNLYQEDGHQVIQCNIRDITERKRTEVALAHLAAIVSSSDDAIISKDLQGIIQNWNEGAQRLFGYTAEEAIGQPAAMLIPPEGEEPRILERISRGEMTDHYETVRRHKDGSLRDISLTVSPIKNAQGEIIGVSKIARDITERKRAEEALRASEERYHTLFDSIDEGFCVIEMLFDSDDTPHDYRFLEVNPAFGKQSGLHDAVGKRMRELAPNHETHWFETYGKVAATGTPMRFVNEAESLGRWFDVYAFRLGGPESRRVAILFTDITDRRRMSDELQQHAVDLAEADRRKNEFLALLAHELRNPLAPILNALQILRLKENSREDVQSASEMMERQISQMVRLVDDLLDVSRISRGTIELRRGRIELASSVHHAVEASRALAQCKGHELTVTLPPLPIYLNADPTRLAQVVGNLLNNACKFTDNGGRIELSVERAGTEAVIRVRDNGIGIAPDQFPRIFEMFLQVDTSLERSVSGLGIGLALVKSLVEMHEGTVEVHSAGVDQGSEFVVRLPVFEETTAPPPEPIVSETPQTPGRRILVVDDNRDSAITLAMLLKLSGNETHIAYDGLEAVEIAERIRPDVALLDIGLPRINGYEVAQRIREQPWGQSMVLVALTGWSQEEDRQRSREAGFNAHMVKPVNRTALTKLLAELLPTSE